MKRFLCVLVIVSALMPGFSCKTYTADNPEEIEYNDVFLRLIDDKLESGQPETAAEMFLRYRENSGADKIPEADIELLERRIAEAFRLEYEKALNGGDYQAALRLKSSAEAAGAEELPGPERLLAAGYINNLLDRGLEAPALAFFQEKMYLFDDPGIMNGTDVKGLSERIAAVSERLGNRHVADFLSKYQAGNTFAGGYSASESINGTVTVIVDRGIKIERGLGYPEKIVGSGFFTDYDGHIITNYHVIESEVDPEYEGFSRLYVKIEGVDQKIPARVIGWDRNLDIALIKIEYEPPFVFTFPEEREFTPGEIIFAIGSPGGLEQTITSGIISASGNRRLLPVGDTLQVDVPINHGNSGGPVLDASGELVGVVFAGIEQFEGVNFVIPSQWLRAELPRLYEGGRLSRGWLGLAVRRQQGKLHVLYSMPGTSAFRAGIKAGDILVSVNGRELAEVEDVQRLLQGYYPGGLVRLVVSDDKGNERSLAVMLEERPDKPMEKAVKIDQRKNLMPPMFGMRVTEGESGLFSTEYLIEEIYYGMSADETGLSVNDPFVITDWRYMEKEEILLMNIRVKKRKAGFLEASIQLGSYIDLNSFV